MNGVDEFTATVETPVDLTNLAIELPPEFANETEARVWAARAGEQNRTFFNEMESGDPVLFYREKEFFASGRVGVTTADPDLGEAL